MDGFTIHLILIQFGQPKNVAITNLNHDEKIMIGKRKTPKPEALKQRQAVYQLIVDHPGITTIEIARKMHLRADIVRRRVVTLEQQNAIEPRMVYEGPGSTHAKWYKKREIEDESEQYELPLLAQALGYRLRIIKNARIIKFEQTH